MTGLETEVREQVREQTPYKCTNRNEVGKSGNVWQVDAVIIGTGGRRVGYIEVKDTWPDVNKSTYINHMRRAYARMGDFRHRDIAKAVVVGEVRDIGHKDWRALLASIDCSLLAANNLDEWLTGL